MRREVWCFLNRNNKKATGKFYINRYDENEKSEKETYPVELKNNKIILKKTISDKNLEKEIENFKFLVSMQILKI